MYLVAGVLGLLTNTQLLRIILESSFSSLGGIYGNSVFGSQSGFISICLLTLSFISVNVGIELFGLLSCVASFSLEEAEVDLPITQ